MKTTATLVSVLSLAIAATAWSSSGVSAESSNYPGDLTKGKHLTYGNLVRHYVVLNKMQRFERVPHARYINFVADFLEADQSATRTEAIAAWTEIKTLDIPKDYASWVKARTRGKGKSR